LATAAKKLGLTRQTVQHHVSKPEVKSEIARLMDKSGLSDSRLLKKLNALIDCKKTITVGSGPMATTEEVDDNAVQVKATELAFKLKGHIKSTEVNVDASQKTLQVFNKLNDEEFDGASVQGMIADLNTGLSGQRKQ